MNPPDQNRHSAPMSIESYHSEKRAAREADARALASGAMQPDELRREYGHFAGLRVKLELKRAKALF